MPPSGDPGAADAVADVSGAGVELPDWRCCGADDMCRVRVAGGPAGSGVRQVASGVVTYGDERNRDRADRPAAQAGEGQAEAGEAGVTIVAIAIGAGFVILAMVIHSALYEVRQQLAAIRSEVARTASAFENLKATFQRIEGEVSREVHTQQDIRNDREHRRRMKLDRELKEGIASGRARIFDG